MDLKSGSRWRCAVSDTEVIVVRAPPRPVNLECSGEPMLGGGAARAASPAAAPPSRTLLGKRYVHEASGLEVLCTKAGAGRLSVDGSPLGLKDAKPLPSSD